MTKHPISKIIYCPNVALVTLPAVGACSAMVGDILTAISEGGVNVDMISQTAPRGGDISLAFTVSADAVGTLLPIVGALKAGHPGLRCEVSPGMCKFNFYDADMVNTPGVAALVFRLLSRVSVHMITTTTVDISIVVEAHQQEDVCQLCREYLDLDPVETVFE